MNGKKPPTKLESAHMGRVKAMSCICCTLLGRKQQSITDVHHIREGRQARNHWLTLPLCHDDCHEGRNGIHGEKVYLRMLQMSELELLACVMERLAKQSTLTIE